MSDKYDVIIIGAGIGGLTAGAILARNGKKVLVLEKNPVPGGYAVNFKRKNFEFDAGLHLMQGCKKNGVVEKILNRCGTNIKFLKPKLLYHSIYPCHDLKFYQSNPRKYLEVLSNNFPDQKGSIKELYNTVEQIFFSLCGIKKTLPFNKLMFYMNKTCLDILNEHIHNRSLIAIIMQLWPYFTLPPSKLSGAYFSYIWYDYITNGGYYPVGGAQTISNRLARAIKSSGGNILFNNEVKLIIVKNNIAKGIINKECNEFFAKNIISNIDCRHTVHDLIGDKYLPKNYVDKIDSMEPAISAFQVYLGLNVDVKKLGFGDYEIFMNSDYDIEKQYTFSKNNNINKVPFSITIYSNLIKNSGPPNSSSIVLTCLSGYDFWDKLSKNEYRTKKKEFAKILIKRAEAILQNLSNFIEVIEIATPLTMKRYTNNYKGSITGWTQALSQSGTKRLSFETPIKNLYLVGGWTRPGGGITGVMYSGELVSNKILLNEKN